ncbi:MAG: InlB B-repeat-containing protein [Coriobacteriia bacterium]|nr:InlB B-repeat-containing protein [Coriobacteriia bacterium]
MMVAVLLPVASQPARAANTTPDNPVIFSVRGTIGGGGAIEYHVLVDDIYAAQTYQSVIITYPAELTINYPAGLTTTWNIDNTTSTNPKSTNMIIRGTTPRSASLLKNDLESMFFTLAAAGAFPPDGSTVSIKASPSKMTFFQDEDGYVHYYEFIASTTTNWLQAYNAAKSRSMQDPRYPDDPTKRLQGYLATITSQAEQDKVYNDIATQCGWLGGTRILQKTPPGGAGDALPATPILDPDSLPETAGQFNNNFRHNTGTATTATNTQYWYWACGPEAGQIFYTQARAAVSGARTPDPATENAGNIPEGFTGWSYYSFWTSGEPNNSDGTARDGGRGGEYVLQFAWSGSPRWNDYSHANLGSIAGYYVEYGGYPDDPKGEDLVGSDVTTTSEVELVMPIIIAYRSTVIEGYDMQGNPIYRMMTAVGTDYDRVITFGANLPYTAVRNEPPGSPGPADILGYKAHGFEFIGQLEDKEHLSLNVSGDVSGFHSTHTQRIVFLYQPTQHTVSFDANFPGWNSASVSPGSKYVSYDTPYGAMAVAIRPGYDFAGWYGNDSGTGPEITAESIGPGYDHTLYAQWAEKSGYTVEYDLNGGLDPDDGTYDNKTGISWTDAGLLPSAAPTRSGYVFAGWKVSIGGAKEGVTSADTYSILATNDAQDTIVLQAQWVEEGRILVIYYMNGATSPVIPDVDVLLTDYVDFPAPTRTGHAFIGWKVINDGFGGTGGTYAAGTSTAQYQDLAAIDASFIILEAQWTANTYTVSYDKNDEGGLVASPYGSPKTGVLWDENGLVPPDAGDPLWLRQVFMGWNTEADGSGTSVYNGTTYAQLAGVDTVDSVVLYAQWLEERTYLVRYDTNGGIPSAFTDKVVYFDEDDLLPPTDPTRTGFDFSGWSVSDNGSKAGVISTDTFGGLATNPNTGYITLQAQYSPKGGLSVHYNLNSAPGTPPPSLTGVVWTQSHLIPLSDPAWGTNVFVGWNTQQDGLGAFITDTDAFSVLAGGIDSFSSVTLYAQWAAAATYTVRYNLNGGSQPETPINNVTLANPNDMVPLSEPVPPAGYAFAHWVVEDNGYGQAKLTEPISAGSLYSDLCYGGALSPTNYIILRAIYSESGDFTVTYDWNWSSSGAPTDASPWVDVRWTDSGFVPHVASQPGFNLIGWTTDAPGANMFIQPTTQYKDLVGGNASITAVTLYAQWEEAHFLVNYDLNGISPPPGNTDYAQRVVAFDDDGLLPLPLPRMGYTLSGWNVSVGGSKAGVQPTDTYRTLADAGAPFITLQAQWTAKEYTVKYDLNGGRTVPGGDTAIPDLPARWWTTSLLPTETVITRPGYTLATWMLSELEGTPLTTEQIAELESEWVENTDTYGYWAAMIDGFDYADITLQAQWVENADVVISYAPKTDGSAIDASGGSVSPTVQSVAPATGSAQSTATASSGYHLEGWYRASDTTYTVRLSTTNTFSPAKDSDGLNTPGDYVARFVENDDVTIYYVSKTVDDITDDAGGSVWPTSQLVAPVSGDAWCFATSNKGYHFVGWYTAEDTGYENRLSVLPLYYFPQSGGAYEDGTTFVALFEEDDGVNITFGRRAVSVDWAPQLPVDRGGSVSGPYSAYYAPVTGAPSSTATTANPGYTFIGWFRLDLGDDYESATLLSAAYTFIPSRDGDGLHVEGHYVAVFKEDASITIDYAALSYGSDGTTQPPNAGGSVNPTTQTIGPASGIAGSEAILSAGYTFIGWFTEGADYLNSAPIAVDLAFSPERDSDELNNTGSYRAVFQENANVTITYSAVPAACGTVSLASESVAPVSGNAAGSTATAKAGFIFDGWYAADDAGFTEKLSSDSHFVPDPDSDGLNLSESYVARFLEDDGVTITITYSVAPVTGGMVSQASETIGPVTGNPSGALATATGGYHFVGWYLDGDLVSDQIGFVPEKTEGIHLAGAYVAVFAEDITTSAPYTVRHYLVDVLGVATLCETEELVGEISATAEATPKTGYVGHTYDVSAPSEVRTGTIAADGSLVLELYYAANVHDIYYVVQGTVPPGAPLAPADELNLPFGSTQNVEANPTLADHVFSGWHTVDCKVDGSGIFTMPDGDVTFTGYWIYVSAPDTVADYTVEHYLVDASGAALLHETGVFSELAGATVTAGPKTGYMGHAYEASYAEGADIEVLSGAAQADNSLVLRLYYPVNRHTISYVFIPPAPGSVLNMPADESGVPYGSLNYVGGNPLCAGYTFSGWFSADCTVVSGGFIMPDSPVTFVGSWIKNPRVVEVRFLDWDGTHLKTEYLPSGWSATAPDAPVRTGYTFIGWDSTYVNVTGDITITALYSQNTVVDDDPGSGTTVPPTDDPSSTGSGTTVPATGDSNSIAALVAALVALALGALSTLRWRRRYRRLDH